MKHFKTIKITDLGHSDYKLLKPIEVEITIDDGNITGEILGGNGEMLISKAFPYDTEAEGYVLEFLKQTIIDSMDIAKQLTGIVEDTSSNPIMLPKL